MIDTITGRPLKILGALTPVLPALSSCTACAVYVPSASAVVSARDQLLPSG